MRSNLQGRSKLRVAIIATVVALVALSLVAASVSAKKKKSNKIKSSVDVSFVVADPNAGTYNAVGTVSSPKAGCKARKIVVVNEDGIVLASGTSEASGKFTVGPFSPTFVDENVYANKKKLGKKTCIRSGKNIRIPGS
jgi:hypothetical protein